MIVMINNEFPPVGGGSATVNRKLFEILQHTDLSITLLTCEIEQGISVQQFSSNIEIAHLSGTKVKNIHHATVFDLLRFSLRSFWKGCALLRKQRPTVVFGWSTVPSGFIAALLGKIFHIPCIVRVSGPDLPGFEKRYTPLYPFLMPLLRWTWRNCDTVIAKCLYEQKIIFEHEPRTRVEIIPNATSIVELKKVEKTPPPEGPLRIVCAARLIERKGIDLLLHAVQRVKSRGFKIQLSLLGTGDEENKLRALAASLGIVEEVCFYGYTPREKLFELYAEAHLFVLPSRNEGMSVAGLEALGCGMPLLLTRTGGAEDIVDDNVNGFIIEIDDGNGLEEKLVYFITHPERISQMGDASLRKARGMTWDVIGNRYRELFNRYR